jgi:uncharacterized protein
MIKRGFKSSIWVFFYLMTYFVFQLTYSIIAAFVIGFRMEITGQGGNLEEVVEGTINSQIPQAIIFAGAASVVVYLVAIRLRNKNFLEECRFKGLPWNKALASGVLGVSGLAVSSILLAGLSLFLDTAYLEHMANMELILGGNKLLVFLSVGIVAPIVEEVIFRGLVFRELERSLRVRAVVVIQALLFGVYHFNLAQGLYTVFLGIVLGLALVWTKSIWAPIIIHMVNNSVSFAFSLVGAENSVVLLIVGLILIAGIVLFPIMLVYLYRTRAHEDYIG